MGRQGVKLCALVWRRCMAGRGSMLPSASPPGPAVRDAGCAEWVSAGISCTGRLARPALLAEVCAAGFLGYVVAEQLPGP